ncbi:glycoside hydrolase family 28 protein [Paenibacillus alkalitolerans]|nr:glycoside hydrolase family 28 protein [Paenibacillus alkalitolerans]
MPKSTRKRKKWALNKHGYKGSNILNTDVASQLHKNSKTMPLISAKGDNKGVECMFKSSWFHTSNMRSKLFSFLLAFVIAFIPLAANFPSKAEAATTLQVYPAPAGIPLNADYTVQVREPGGVWQDLDEYRTTVGHPTKYNASFVYFDTDGQVEMSVTYNAGTLTSARIRGLNTVITPNINGNTMTFSMSGPMKLSVEVNGDINKHLMIFANPLEVNPPSPSDPNVIYLGPGIYQEDYTVPSGKTLYIAGGAVVQGAINFDNATNAKVIGRGVLDRPVGRAISVDYANQITIDGIIVNNYGSGNNGGCAINVGNSSNVLINNFKAYGVNKWGDGIDVFSSTNVTINDAYIRSHDDSVAVYNARANGGRIWYGDTKNNIRTCRISEYKPLFPGVQEICRLHPRTVPGDVGRESETLNSANGVAGSVINKQ